MKPIMITQSSLTVATVSAVAILVGCAVGPDHEPPSPALSGSWSALEEAADGQTSVATSKSAEVAEWWRSFDDPTLTALIERALDANLDLRAAAARVREARGLRGVALGALLPEADARGGYERVRWSSSGLFPWEGGGVDFYQAGFDASWEIDVFGGNGRRVEAAGADLAASVEDLRDVRVSLLAEVARAYVELRGFQSRLGIARRNLETQSETVEITRARLDAGQGTELDVARAEAQVSTTAATIPALEASLRQTVHRLAVLLAREPGALDTELASALDADTPIPSAPAEIPVGLPTDLLRRRPDIRRAERELAAATARIGVATADLYPRFFLTGSAGLESIKASDFFDKGNDAWSFGPSIRWSVFQGGRIRANIEAHDARQEQAALRFERTLLDALRDVEDALVAHSREQLRRTSLLRAVESQRRAVELASERYTLGLIDFLSVLEAQRSLLASQDTLVESEQAVATNAIALYKAIGGGWRPETPAPETPETPDDEG